MSNLHKDALIKTYTRNTTSWREMETKLLLDLMISDQKR